MKSVSGKALIGIGILHCSVGLWFGADTATSIGADGLIGAVEPHLDRMYWFWFMVTGVLMLVVGHLVHWLEARLHQRAPAFLGWELLLVGLLATAAIPFSGGWLVIAAALYIIAKARTPILTS